MKHSSFFLSWKLLLGAGALAAAVAVSGCGKQDGGSAAGGEKVTVAFIPKGMQHVYWKSVEAGMRQAEQDARANGMNLEVIWNGPPNEGDRNGQISMVENYIGQKLDGIILCPMDADALVAPTEKAVRAGIPVVIVDSPLNYDKVVSLVATDNEKAGEMAGEELARLIGGKGNVIMMPFMPGSASTEYRERGFLKVMAKYPDIKVLSSKIYAGDTREKALSNGENLLNTYKAEGVQGVFTPNEPSTNGMLLALRNTGNAGGKIKFVGFDGGTQNMEGLNAGDIQALILQDPYKMGKVGVEVMVAKLTGQPVEARVDTGTVLMTKDNQDSPAVKELLKNTVQ